MITKNNAYGFTLIELMIVVTIIGILAAIAYPSYNNYVTKSRRVDATGDLLELSQYMERFFTENGRYDQDTGSTALTIDTLPFKKSPNEGSSTFYNISFTAGPTPTSYTLSASPAGAQATNDTDCAVLSYNSVAVKCIKSGASCSNVEAQQAAVGDCW